MEEQIKKIKVIDIISPAEKKAEPILRVQRESFELPEKRTEEKKLPESKEVIRESKIETPPKEDSKLRLDIKILDGFKIKPESEKEIKRAEPVLVFSHKNQEDKKEDKEDGESFLKKEAGASYRGSKAKRYVLYFFILIVFGGGFYSAFAFLPSAEIKIVTKKSAWNFSDSVMASKSAADVNLAAKQIPAEIFSDRKNASLAYPATAKKWVERKASGEITIYNAYSSQSQTLVRNTRLESSSGKTYFLDAKTTIPGAKIEEGKIIPSDIKAKITAKDIGDSYNLEPSDKFFITGFKGTAKYDNFYGIAENGLKGGFVGEILYPSNEDIKSAREKTITALKENIQLSLLSQISKDFKIIDGASQFSVLKEDIPQEADKDGNFLVAMEGEFKIIAFKESDLLRLMAKSAKSVLGENFEAKEQGVQYGNIQPDFGNGNLSLDIDYKGTFWQPVDVESFKQTILDKNENELKVAVFSLAGIEKAKVSFWPFWVKSVPDNIEKVKVGVE